MKNEKDKMIQALTHILENLRQIYKNESDENVRKSIRKMTRTLICVSFEGVPADYISIKAKGELDKLKKEFAVRQFPWNLRRQANYKKYFRNLTYEHCVPLKELIADIYGSTKEIEKIMNDLTTAWITTGENKKLNKNGYKNNRRPFKNQKKRKLGREDVSSWRKCYKLCKIPYTKGV